MKDLLAAKSNIDDSDSDGMTPLHRSAFGAKPNATRFLVRAKASLSMTDKDGRTPLEVADRGERTTEREVVISILQEAEREFARKNPK